MKTRPYLIVLTLAWTWSLACGMGPSPAPPPTAPPPVANPGPPAATTDPYGFIPALNRLRAGYGLSAVSYDADLAAWAALNNQQQAARGLGHYVTAPGCWSNAAMCSYSQLMQLWLNSPPHRANLLRPGMSRAGIAGGGQWWTLFIR